MIRASLTPSGQPNIYYGTTSGGGSSGDGALIEFNATTGSLTLKSSFNLAATGKSPSALTAGGNGIFYGTTRTDLINGYGSIFEFNANTNSLAILATTTSPGRLFGLTPGASPGIFYGSISSPNVGESCFNCNGYVYEFNANNLSLIHI